VGADAAGVDFLRPRGSPETLLPVTDPASVTDALFVPEGDQFLPTHLTEGPWDAGAQFGGAPSSLLAALVEAVPTLVPMHIARLTVDLLHPVPLTSLRPAVRVVREGKRIQVVEASLWSGALEVARCSSLRVRLVDIGHLDLPTGESPHSLPDGIPTSREAVVPGQKLPAPHLPVEYLFEGAGGNFNAPVWVRLCVPVIAGQPASPMVRLAYLSDLASGVGYPKDPSIRSINADLALNVTRYPVGEWLKITGTARISHAGIGQTQATIFDTFGAVASVSMTRLVDPLPAATDTKWVGEGNSYSA
jgi:hypothetical protein